MIYFIGNIEKDICKIGFSKRPTRRIKTIRSSVDYHLSIFDIIEGTIEEEKLIHSLNDKARITGEWYVLSKVKSLDLNKHVKTINVGSIELVMSKDGYYHGTTLINSIDEFRVKRNMHKLNFYNWMKTNEVFIDSFRNKGIIPIKQGYAYWVHPYIAVEILRTDPILKLIAYENVAQILESVRIGVKENVKE